MRLVEPDGNALLASAGILVPRGTLVESAALPREAPRPAAKTQFAILFEDRFAIT